MQNKKETKKNSNDEHFYAILRIFTIWQKEFFLYKSKLWQNIKEVNSEGLHYETEVIIRTILELMFCF